MFKGKSSDAILKIPFLEHYIPQGCDIKNRPPSICKHNHYLPEYQKTGPEAGQYFHVRPPIRFI